VEYEEELARGMAEHEGRWPGDRRWPDEDRQESRSILGMRVDWTSYSDATRRIVAWAKSGQSRYVCVASVYNVMLAHDHRAFLRVMNGADLVTPDGMPLVWGLRALGVNEATRVYGPDLTPFVLDRAQSEGLPVGFYGGSPEVLSGLLTRVRERWPALDVPYAFSPPFRPLPDLEDRRITREINAAGPSILFVGLGCPKQENWMADHQGKVNAVMVGVGAAFDFMAGMKRQAPRFMQRTGTEWLFRLATEPRRLWKRYLKHNPRFVMHFSSQLVVERFARSGKS
jgi:N-acetylglucosaminyldiphosphoundecaprenol N-acetyl-beta-D-mannosaminyltransferase